MKYVDPDGRRLIFSYLIIKGFHEGRTGENFYGSFEFRFSYDQNKLQSNLNKEYSSANLTKNREKSEFRYSFKFSSSDGYKDFIIIFLVTEDSDDKLPTLTEIDEDIFSTGKIEVPNLRFNDFIVYLENYIKSVNKESSQNDN